MVEPSPTPSKRTPVTPRLVDLSALRRCRRMRRSCWVAEPARILPPCVYAPLSCHRPQQRATHTDSTRSGKSRSDRPRLDRPDAHTSRPTRRLDSTPRLSYSPDPELRTPGQ